MVRMRLQLLSSAGHQALGGLMGYPTLHYLPLTAVLDVLCTTYIEACDSHVGGIANIDLSRCYCDCDCYR